MYTIATAGQWDNQTAEQPWWAEFPEEISDDALRNWAYGFIAGLQAMGQERPCYEYDRAHGRTWLLVHTGFNRDGTFQRFLPENILDGFKPTKGE